MERNAFYFKLQTRQQMAMLSLLGGKIKRGTRETDIPDRRIKTDGEEVGFPLVLGFSHVFIQ